MSMRLPGAGGVALREKVRGRARGLPNAPGVPSALPDKARATAAIERKACHPRIARKIGLRAEDIRPDEPACRASRSALPLLVVLRGKCGPPRPGVRAAARAPIGHRIRCAKRVDRREHVAESHEVRRRTWDRRARPGSRSHSGTPRRYRRRAARSLLPAGARLR